MFQNRWPAALRAGVQGVAVSKRRRSTRTRLARVRSSLVRAVRARRLSLYGNPAMDGGPTRAPVAQWDRAPVS